MHKTQKKGMVILFAMLTIGLLMGIGIAMSGITQKQLILSSLGRLSQVAFYAADTGAECARYYDIKDSTFNKFDGSGNLITTGSITCGENFNIPVTITQVDSNHTKGEFTISLSAGESSGIALGQPGYVPGYNYCSLVEVTKILDTDETIIESRGYNLPCGSSYSTRKVERAVRVTY